jgi:hypothetical protein
VPLNPPHRSSAVAHESNGSGANGVRNGAAVGAAVGVFGEIVVQPNEGWRLAQSPVVMRACVWQKIGFRVLSMG